MSPIKTKLLVATEPESSWTGRITPFDLGELFAKVGLAQMDKFLEGLDSIRMYYPKETKDYQNAKIKAWLEQQD